MTPELTLRRFCCPQCGGHRVQTLDWVTVNDDEFIGGDIGADYWCPDCEEHPGHVEDRDVTFSLCVTCSHHSWGTRVPLPGVWLRADGSVERCPTCELYATDLAAAQATSAELARRGGPGGVVLLVPGLTG